MDLIILIIVGIAWFALMRTTIYSTQLMNMNEGGPSAYDQELMRKIDDLQEQINELRKEQG